MTSAVVLLSHLSVRPSIVCHLPVICQSCFCQFVLIYVNHISFNQSLPIICQSIFTYHVSLNHVSVSLYLLSVNHISLNKSIPISICQSYTCQSILYLSVNLYLSSINHPLQTCQSHICLVYVLIYHLSISGCISISAVS